MAKETVQIALKIGEIEAALSQVILYVMLYVTQLGLIRAHSFQPVLLRPIELMSG